MTTSATDQVVYFQLLDERLCAESRFTIARAQVRCFSVSSPSPSLLCVFFF